MTRRDVVINTVASPLLVALIAVLALAVSARHFVRLDLTRDGDFSLEPVTLSLLEQVDDRLTIRVYFTADLEPPYHNAERIVRDLLDEYRARDPGHLNVEWVDPGDDPGLKDEARRLGIEPATLEVSAEGRREAREIWMGMAFVYQDRIETLPTVLSLDDLEYQVTRRLRAVLFDRNAPVVGFLHGHGEPDVAEGTGALESIRGRIEENYEVRKVGLAGGAMVPDDVDVLILLGPREPLGEPELFALDQYLMSGRPAAFFRSSLAPDARTRDLRRSSDNLGELLAWYGIAMETTVVADRFSNGLMPVPVGRSGRTGQVNHPLIPLASDLDRDQVITRGVDTLALPLCSPLTVVDDAGGCPDCEVLELARTGKRSVALARVGTLDPADYISPQLDEQPGPFLVAAALEGSLRTYHAEGFRGEEVDPDSPPGTRLLVVSSVDYALKNLGFFFNTLDWLALDADLLALRPDQSLPPVMKPLGRATTHLVRLVNLLALPTLLVVLAVMRSQRRRSR